jgi:formylglycine-generating enzyme
MRFPHTIGMPWIPGVGLAVLAIGLAVAIPTWSAVPSDCASSHAPCPQPSPSGMVWIPGGEFTMGSTFELARTDEKPPHRVRVDGVWMDATEVTNAQFRQFVDATGYVTTAEQPPKLEEIMAQLPPGSPPPPRELLVPGSLVFTLPSKGEVGGWQWTPGANWRQPEGPGNTLADKDAHPVVHVSWFDATA